MSCENPCGACRAAMMIGILAIVLTLLPFCVKLAL